MSDSGQDHLPPIPTEFERLCKVHGGPKLIYGVEEGGDSAYRLSARTLHALESACSEYPFVFTWETFREWEPDETSAFRHWPWIAFATTRYAFEQKVKLSYVDDEPRPRDIEGLIEGIEASAASLKNDLARLFDLGNRLGDMQTQRRRGHIAQLSELISQNLLSLRDTVDERPLTELASFYAFSQLCNQLVAVEVAAGRAKTLFDKDALRLAKKQSDPGLISLVFRCGAVWESLTRKRPSVYKSAGPLPPFVRFIGNVANLAEQPSPTPAAVATALKVYSGERTSGNG